MGKKLLFGLVVLLLLIAVPLTVFLVSQQQDIRNKAAPATTLSLSPSTITKGVGETFPVDVVIDTGANQIQGVYVVLQYDDQVLEVVPPITNSPQFPNILASELIEGGRASIAIGTNPAQPFQGSGTVATFQFRAKTGSSSTTIRFTSETYANSPGEGATNALIQTAPATVTVSGGATSAGALASTPTPTLQLTGTISLTPTPTKKNAKVVNLSLIQPPKSGTTNKNPPTLSGTATPSSALTISLYPDNVTGAVSANALGNWSFIPQSPLTPGPITVTLTSTDPATGKSDTLSSDFVLASGSAVPVTGSVDLTILILTIGTIFLGSGAVLFLARGLSVLRG